MDPELVYVSKVASSAWVKLGMVSSKAVSSAWIELGVVSSSGRGFAAPAAPAAAGVLAGWGCVGATTLEMVGASSAGALAATAPVFFFASSAIISTGADGVESCGR